MAEAVVEAESLTKRYGERRGIEEVTFRVERGEVFGFLGPNGAGKTTTMRLLLDLLRPTSGHARVLGLDVREHATGIHSRLGYLPGELALYERMTGDDFLRHAANLRGGVDWGHVADLERRFKLDASKPIRALSRGNKQKVGLIQALMHKPDLLILDEPTSGLDPLMQGVFEDLVRKTRAEGRTVFLSSHDLAEVERVCDRVAIIREGRIVAVETVENLKARAARRVEVRFAKPVPPGVFQALAGVSDVRLDDRLLTCTVSGGFDPLVKALAGHRVDDLVVREPRLEDVFRAYYREAPE